ncbi:SEL1-like repeat protein [Pedobacter gandavensis]|uniref:SEL1-like repeat protein n=1 Tax=Pedobacter gandavensis TaxID=2679963 RepID=UPI00292FD5FE|nr:SEL1-like repeat protein [Pedobacter gandavensis]
MSHRTYLYNINTPSVAENADTMMMEWGYEMPLMLQPLLIEGGFISGNNYNNFIAGSNSGLYYDAKPGVENLKRFYNFLENQPELIENIEKFKAARDKLFSYLDELDGRYFHLDMWDVLNMEDRSHAKQAKDWLATIAHNNQVITMAMDAEDASLLNYKVLKDVTSAFNTFSKLLNYEDYDYGWTCISQPDEEEPTFEIFEENELWGLKGKDGAVLLNPYYDEFFNFGPQDLAVVSKTGKYGYLNITGNVAIPLTWDDAFDFEESGVAVVILQGKTGLINTKGSLVTELIYDDLKSIEYGEYFNAKIGERWGMINASGKICIAFEHENEIQAGYAFYHIAVSGQKNQKIFNEFFKYLGEFPISAIENLEDGFLFIKPFKGVKGYSIYKKDGMLLDNGFDLVVRKPAGEGFAYAFKEDKIYTVSETNISLSDKAITLEHTGDDYAYHFDYKTRKKLLTYGKGQIMTDQQIDDQLSHVYTTFELAEQAFMKEDYATAIYFYTIGSEKGHLPSMNNLAHIYYINKGFEDEDKAYFWYRKGALTGNKDSMNGLGMCYKYGIGCQVDLEKTLYWLHKAAEAQLALANNNLGDIYADEGFLHFNLDKALEHFLAAANLGEPKYNWLGYLYDLKEEYEKALEYYQSGANKGHEIATYNLAVLHSHGLGTDKNIEVAIAYFKLAVTRGYEPAHIELARIHRNEEGFKDENKVETHLKEARAAELEIPEDLLTKKKGWFDF